MSLDTHPMGELWAKCKRTAQVCTENPPFGPGVIRTLVLGELAALLRLTADGLQTVDGSGEWEAGYDTAIRELREELLSAANTIGGDHAEQR